MIKLQPTSEKYEFGCEGDGRKTIVTTALDEEWGWEAMVVFKTYSSPTSEQAVKNLKDDVEKFLKQLNEG